MAGGVPERLLPIHLLDGMCTGAMTFETQIFVEAAAVSAVQQLVCNLDNCLLDVVGAIYLVRRV